MEQPQHKIMVTSNISNVYDIQIHGDIEGPESMSSELAAIAQATENDIINVSICTDGGQVQTALLVRTALRKTPAKTRGLIGPNCCSSGTIIALSCDEWELDEHSMFMIHSATFGVFGKHNEVAGQYAFKMKWLAKVYKDVYSGFLSEQEIEQFTAGQDIWLDAQELSERLGYFAEYRKALYLGVDTEDEEA